MKVYTIIILFLLACSCAEKNKSLKTNDVFVVWYPTDFDGKRIVVKDTNTTIRFSREFWNYFLQSHPKVSLTIFASHLYEEHYPWLDTGDSAYSYYEVGNHPYNLGAVLADSAGGIEKSGELLGTVWKNDSLGRPIPYRPQGMKVSPVISKEFEQFKHILSYRDSARHYVIVYWNQILGS